ncbi:NADH:flavin oxidoreductase [Balneicella halophila]|nr:NADH:flavin oxidoreductase [Balneicella halophila]
MPNRFMLAPLTNRQSLENGQATDTEIKWLTMRAEGGFGIVMTCAAHVQKAGKGFPGQLGIFSDDLIEGHKKITKNIKQHGSLAIIQLHHAGMRSPIELLEDRPVSASDDKETNSRGLSLKEVEQLRDDFISAAVRSKKCGYDGVQIHGAHGYIITQFLSAEINKRTDKYGGILENRACLLFEIVDGIRQECGKDFLICIRLSPERFGMDIDEIKTIAQRLIDGGNIDCLDFSLWDCFKYPEEEKYQEKTLLEHFKELNFKKVKWTVAGKIYTAEDVHKVLKAGVDFVTIGKSAILHHDFPKLVMNNPNFTPIQLPVSKEHLQKEGLGNTFIQYLNNRWEGFVK